MLRQNYFHKSVFKGNFYRISKLYVRNFSKSQRIFYPPESLPNRPVAPFSELTDDIRLFIEERLLINSMAIEQLDHTIQVNNNNIRSLYNQGNWNANNDAHIEALNNLIEQDINVREMHQESVNLLGALYMGHDPPVHNMTAWLHLRNDLDNSEDLDLQNLTEYVREIIDTNIADQFLEMAMDAIRIGRENRLDTESRDNSQYSDELDSELESNSDVGSNSDAYHSAETHIDEFSSSDSDLNDNLSAAADQGLNSNDNLSNASDEFNYDVDPYYDSLESNSNINQSFDQNKSNLSSDEKSLTDDALDISDTLQMFYDEPSVENKSTVDFVLQRQQEEMPDIMDSDGGD